MNRIFVILKGRYYAQFSPVYIFMATLIIGWTLSPLDSAMGNTITADIQMADSLIIQDEYSEEMNQLMNEPAIVNALDYIENTDDQVIEDQILLTEIPAPPFGEQKRGEKFAEMLQQYGADSVWTDNEGNVIGFKKGTERERVLAIAGHLDTVFPIETDVSVEMKGDTLFAPGISDDGRGITTVLSLLRTVNENDIKLKSDILFIGNVGEEGLGDLRGMKYLFREDGPQIDTFISVDGTRFSGIVNGALGSHRYRVTFEGPGGHSWGAFGLANPHHAAARAITHFVDAADVYTQEGLRTSYNIGRIGGGTSVNSIPFESWFEVDMRSLSPERLNEIDEIFQDAMHKGLDEQNALRRHGPEMTVDLNMIGNRPSGHTSTDEEIVQKAAAITREMGEEPSISTSSTDSNIPISMGIPAITIGGGGEGGAAHSLDEWFLNTDGYRGIQRAFLIITAIAEYDN